MKKLVIVGIGSFGELLKYYIDNYDEREVVAFAVNRAFLPSSCQYCGLPVFPLETLPACCPPTQFDIILGVGYKKMNTVRRELFHYCKSMGYKIASFIHPSACISKDAEIGEGNIILESFVMSPFCRLGEGNLLWADILLGHNVRVGDFNTISGQVGLSGFSSVGNCCFLGMQSLVFDHVALADYTLLGAGAAARKSSSEYEIIVPTQSVILKNKRSVDSHIFD